MVLSGWQKSIEIQSISRIFPTSLVMNTRHKINLDWEMCAKYFLSHLERQHLTTFLQQFLFLHFFSTL